MVKYTVVESYENYGRCLKISNDTIEAYVTTDVGPRIIKFGFCGGQNMMFNDLERQTIWEGEEYDAYFFKGAVSYLYGGHRIWVTPERKPETNYPDNEPVEVKYTDKGIVFIPPVQKKNDIQLELEINMDLEGANMQVLNRVTNVRDTEQEFAVWTISVMNKGGLEIVKHSDVDTGLLPNRVISLWPYSNPADYRFYNGKKFMSVKHDAAADRAFKFGTNNQRGKAVYALNGDVFRKEWAPFDASKPYPDGGVSFESYTSDLVLELEVLGPVEKVAPGKSAVLEEKWSLVAEEFMPDARDDAELEEFWNKVWAK